MRRLFVILPLIAIFCLSSTGCQWYSNYDGPVYGPPPHRHPSHGYGLYGERKKFRQEAGGLFKKTPVYYRDSSI